MNSSERLRAQLPRDRAVEHWLRDKVVPAYDAAITSPARAVTPKKVRAALAKAHKRYTPSR